MVTVLRDQDGASYVSEGLNPGDLVITTRLVNPMPGIKLQHAEVTDREPPP